MVEDDIHTSLTPGHAQLPQLMFIPDQRVMTQQTELQRFASDKVAELQASRGIQMQQLNQNATTNHKYVSIGNTLNTNLPVNFRRVTIDGCHPRDCDLHVAAGSDVHVNGVGFLVLGKEDVDGGFVLEREADVKRLHLSFVARLWRFCNFHREVVGRVEKFEEVFALAVRPRTVTKIRSYKNIYCILKKCNSHKTNTS